MTDDQQARLEEAMHAALDSYIADTIYEEEHFRQGFKCGAAWQKADIEVNRDLTVEYLVGYSQGKADEAKRVADLLHTLNGDSYNSVRETLALMTEGEGDDPSVYQDMAGSALFKLDKALRVYERGDT